MTTTKEAKSNPDIADPHELLESCMLAALETYSNVHRGSGPASAIATLLYEKARNVVLNYLGLNPKRYQVFFVLHYGPKSWFLKWNPATIIS